MLHFNYNGTWKLTSILVLRWLFKNIK